MIRIRLLLAVWIVLSALLVVSGCASSAKPATEQTMAPQPAPAPPPKARRRPTLFIVGDSTVKNSTRGQVGWGSVIGKYFDDSRINVQNHAIGGRSSRTFQTEGRWNQILAVAKPGDFVLIQLGHNDGGPLDDKARARGTIRGIGDESKEIYNPITKKHELVHTYGWYMRKYVTDAKAHRMIPIICSPVPRCPTTTVKAGDVDKTSYVLWSKQVSDQEHALFIPLNALIMQHYVGMTSKQIWDKYYTPMDHTHSSPAGAELNAQCVVEGIRGLKHCSLKDYLRD